MPDLIRHPVLLWIPAPVPDIDPGFAGMTVLAFIVAGVILTNRKSINFHARWLMIFRSPIIFQPDDPVAVR